MVKIELDGTTYEVPRRVWDVWMYAADRYIDEAVEADASDEIYGDFTPEDMAAARVVEQTLASLRAKK